MPHRTKQSSYPATKGHPGKMPTPPMKKMTGGKKRGGK